MLRDVIASQFSDMIQYMKKCQASQCLKRLGSAREDSPPHFKPYATSDVCLRADS